MTSKSSEPECEAFFNKKYGLELGKTIMLYEKSLETKQQALSLDASGNWRKALDILPRVSELQCQAFNGKESEPHVPQLMHNIGVVYASKKEYVKAIDAYRYSLELQRKLTGDMNAGVASALTNLGLAFQELEQPRHDRAQFLYEKALEIRRAVLDPMDPLIADTLHQLALTHEEQAGSRYRRPGGMMVHRIDKVGRNAHHSQARDLYWKCLKIRVPVLGDSHLDTIATLFNLGLSLRNTVLFGRSLWMKNNKKIKVLLLSKHLLSRALKSFKLAGSTIDPEDMAACMQYLATVELELSNWSNAMNLFQSEFNLLTKMFEPGAKFWLALREGIDITPKKGLLGEALCGKGMCLVRLNRLPEAIVVYREARKVLSACRVVEDSKKAKKLTLGGTTGKEFRKRVVGPRIMDLFYMSERCYQATLKRHNQLVQIETDKRIAKEEQIKEEKRLRRLRPKSRTKNKSGSDEVELKLPTVVQNK
jgi:tetratricopeptide (TPR) repeat protein